MSPLPARSEKLLLVACSKRLLRDTVRLACFAALLLLATVGALPADEHSERGLMFSQPHNGEWNQMGAVVGNIGDPRFNLMSPQSIKVAHGRLEKFMPSDENAHAFFPYEALKAFEAKEIAAGRPPIFVTATYQGKKRPVYFLPALPVGSPSPLPLNDVVQAVNVRDERFIRFWIDRYARPILKNSPPNTWIGLDDCRFSVSMYGVLDDEDKFVAGVPWDKPFPQNDDEFLDGLCYFMKRLKTLAPEIKVMCNVAALDDWRRFPEVYKDIHGIVTEDILIVHKILRSHIRLTMYRQLIWFGWLSSKNKVAVLRAEFPQPDADRLRIALIMYLLVRGNQSLFAPQSVRPSPSIEVAPSEYAAMKSALGTPQGEMQSRREPDQPNDGFRLYWRRCTGGIVYLNYSGTRQTITLPNDRVYYNRNGQPVTSISIDDLNGDYVLTQPK